MNISELRDLIRELVNDALNETSVTGNIGIGAGPIKTPKAFTGNKAKFEKKRKDNAEQLGFSVVKDIVNEYKSRNPKVSNDVALRLMDVVNTYAEGITTKWMENALETVKTSPDHFFEMAKQSIPPTVLPKFRTEFEKVLGRPVESPSDIGLKEADEDPLGGPEGGDEKSDMEVEPEDYGLELSMQAQELITFLKSDSSVARMYQIIEDKFKQLKNPTLKLAYAMFIPFVEKAEKNFIEKNSLDMSVDEYFMPSDKFKVAAFLGQELFDQYGKREDEEPEEPEMPEMPEPEGGEEPGAPGGAPPPGGGAPAGGGLPKPEDLK